MLKEGLAVRYQGLGAGRVVNIVVRSFKGKDTRFAVIDFPHRNLQAQIPAEDPSIEQKLSPVCSARSLRKMLQQLEVGGSQLLPRTWDHREEMGKKKLTQGGPEDWVDLLASYALAERHGVEIVSSDHDLIHQAIDLLAAELACAEKKDFDPIQENLEKRYEKASEVRGAIDENVHFGSERLQEKAGVSK